MKNYYIGYCDNMSLMENRVISGASPVDAVRRTYPGKQVVRLNSEESRRFANIIITECSVGTDGKPCLLWGAKSLGYAIKRRDGITKAPCKSR